MTTGRARAFPRFCALVAALALPLAGCAASGGGPGGAGTPAPTAAGRTALTVTADPRDGTGPRTWTLTCDPSGGTHPRAPQACAQLAAAAAVGVDPFAPTPPMTMCSELYGGPERATVTGTLGGTAVAATFSRTNGCEVQRWDRVFDLLVVRAVARVTPVPVPSASGSLR